jgi:hypothetical protein
MLLTVILVWEFGRAFSPLSEPYIKLSSFAVLERKEKKEDTLLCTGVNKGLLNSVLNLQVFYLRLFL